MPLKTLVKVGNITNLSDARYCAGMGVEMLGFDVVAGSSNFIEPQKYQEIRGWVSGPKVVAEVYGLSQREEFTAVIENYAPDYLELTVKEIDLLGDKTPLPLILKIDQSTFNGSLSKIELLKEKIAYVIINQVGVDSDFITTIGKTFPILLEPTKDFDVNAALESLPIQGFSLTGTHEEKPGLKDYDHLSAVLEVLDAD